MPNILQNGSSSIRETRTGAVFGGAGACQTAAKYHIRSRPCCATSTCLPASQHLAVALQIPAAKFAAVPTELVFSHELPSASKLTRRPGLGAGVRFRRRQPSWSRFEIAGRPSPRHIHAHADGPSSSSRSQPRHRLVRPPKKVQSQQLHNHLCTLKI